MQHLERPFEPSLVLRDINPLRRRSAHSKAHLLTLSVLVIHTRRIFWGDMLWLSMLFGRLLKLASNGQHANQSVNQSVQ